MGTSNAATSGRGRKTLADQLDRLDTILDGLDAALTAVVAPAVGDAVRSAVDGLVRQREGFDAERPPGPARPGVARCAPTACGRTGAKVYAAASMVGGAIRRAWVRAAARPRPPAGGVDGVGRPAGVARAAVRGRAGSSQARGRL